MTVSAVRCICRGLLLSTTGKNTVYHTRNMSTITFKSENAQGDCPGYLQGDVSKTKKGLIVLQEWWGMNDQIKLEAKEIGDMGSFVTLVPDLYRGKIGKDNEEAGHLMNNLDWAGAVKDIKGAAQYLLSNGCNKVGVTGFCMGGALSLAGAALVPELTAAAPFYGIPSKELCDVGTITIPVQAHFGEADHIEGFSSKKDAEALKEKLKKNPEFEMFFYQNCGHGFTNKTGPLGNYNEEASSLALQRMTDFMNKHLAC